MFVWSPTGARTRKKRNHPLFILKKAGGGVICAPSPRHRIVPFPAYGLAIAILVLYNLKSFNFNYIRQIVHETLM